MTIYRTQDISKRALVKTEVPPGGGEAPLSVGPSDSPRAAPPRQTAVVAFASGFRNSLGAAAVAFMLRFCDTWKHPNALTEPFG
jgi:hypothetical protein